MTTSIEDVRRQVDRRLKGLTLTAFDCELFDAVSRPTGLTATAVQLRTADGRLDDVKRISVYIPPHALIDRLRHQHGEPTQTLKLKQRRSFRLAGAIELYGDDHHLQLNVSQIREQSHAPIDSRIRVGYQRARRRRRTDLPRWPVRVAFAGRTFIKAYRDVESGLPGLVALESAECPMRGPAVIDSLVSMLARCDRSELDLVVVARGGGSEVDLVPFSDPDLIDAADACPVPVISAIGHSGDRCALDNAVISVATPSRVSGMIERRLRETGEELTTLRSAIADRATRLDETVTSLGERIVEQRKQFEDQARHRARRLLAAVSVVSSVMLATLISAVVNYGWVGWCGILVAIVGAVGVARAAQREGAQATEFLSLLDVRDVVSRRALSLELPIPRFNWPAGRDLARALEVLEHRLSAIQARTRALTNADVGVGVGAHPIPPGDAERLHQYVELILATTNVHPVDEVDQLHEARSIIDALTLLLTTDDPRLAGRAETKRASAQRTSR